MTDLSLLQKEIASHPSPMLYGPPAVVDGWCSLELHERGNAFQVLRNYDTAVSLWYRGLLLFRNGFTGGATVWRIPQDEPHHSATRTRINLLGLEVSAAKAALDMTLSGYYSIAFASIRHMLEATAQGMFLYLFPEEHISWDPESQSPQMGKTIQRIKKELKHKGYTDEECERFEDLYKSWKRMSKGSHPSGVGLLQVIAQGDEDLNAIGASYRPDFVDRAFDSGLFALFMLLVTFPQLRVLDENWTSDLRIWIDDRQQWRQSLRAKLGLESDLDLGAVRSNDLDLDSI